MSDEDITRFYEEFRMRGRDPDAAAVALLDEGMHWKDVDSSPPPGSNIREATMAEVCAVYNIPLQLVGQSDRNLGIAKELFLTETLPPYLTAFEDRLDQDLVPDFGDERIFTEHLLEQKLRGSWIEQSKMLAVIGGKDGFLTPNECRALLNFPPITGGDTLPPRS